MLGAYEPDGNNFRSLITSANPLKILGITGLAAHGPHIFAVTQADAIVTAASAIVPKYYLMVIARDTLKVLNCHQLHSVRDPHSMCWIEGKLYVASSGTDEIIQIHLD